MPFEKIGDITDPAEYKKILKQEVNKVKGSPVKFQYFENFPFTGQGKKPLLIVGKVETEVLDAVKNIGGTFKGKGRCAKKGERLQFKSDSGKVPGDKINKVLKFATLKENAEEVEELAAPDEADLTPVAPEAAVEVTPTGWDDFKNQMNALTTRLKDIEKEEPALHGTLSNKLIGGKGSAQSGDLDTAGKVLKEVEDELRKAKARIEAREVAKKEREASEKEAAAERAKANEDARKAAAEDNPDEPFVQAKEKIGRLIARAKAAIKAKADSDFEGKYATKSGAILTAIGKKTLEGLSTLLEELETLVTGHEKVALASERLDTVAAAKDVGKAAKDADDAVDGLAASQEYKDAKKRLSELQAEIVVFRNEITGKEEKITGLAKTRANAKKAKKYRRMEELDDEIVGVNKEIAAVNTKIEKVEEEAKLMVTKYKSLEAPVKQLLALYAAMQSRVDKLIASSSVHTGEDDEGPGSIEDNPALKEARDAIAGKVGEMADASKWQKEQVAAAVSTGGEKHGTGRHGAQSGIEGAARREATGVMPDQVGNRAGVARSAVNTNTWRVNIKWQVNEDGTRELINAGQVKTYVENTTNEKFPPPTTTLFLNPVLEKYAVDKALDVAKQCTWKWQYDGEWKRMYKLVINVPPKAGTVGYGYAVNPTAPRGQMAVLAANAHIQQFVQGTIDIDTLMQRLDVELEKDWTGVGAKILPNAKVILYRKKIEDDWDNETQHPTAEAVGWEIQGARVTGGTKEPSPTLVGVTAPAAAF